MNRRIEIVLLNPKGESRMRNRCSQSSSPLFVIPVSITFVKVHELRRNPRRRFKYLHRHIVNALSLSTNAYYQGHMRLAFAPLLARTRVGEQVRF